MVAVDSETYEGLLTTRRQLGARHARVQILRRELAAAEQRLAAVASALAGHGHTAPASDHLDADLCDAAGCLRCLLLRVLAPGSDA